MSIIRIIDFESTGLEPPAKIIEVGTTDLDMVSLEISNSRSYLCFAESIPAESREVNHIWAEDLVGSAPFDAKVEIDLAKRDGITAFAAHNCSFEQQWLPRDIPMVCTYKAALRMLDFAPAHSNFGLLYWLMDNDMLTVPREQITPAHRAMPDSVATAHLLKLLVSNGATLEKLIQWTSEPRLLPRCPIGEWRNSPWGEVDIGFLRWMTSKKDMDSDLKWNAQQEIDKRKNGVMA